MVLVLLVSNCCITVNRVAEFVFFAGWFSVSFAVDFVLRFFIVAAGTVV